MPTLVKGIIHQGDMIGELTDSVEQYFRDPLLGAGPQRGQTTL